MPPKRIKRDQHPGFGREIRALISSNKSEDRARGAIVIEELAALSDAKAEGRRHSKEDSLEGALAEVSYLRLYSSGYSIRVYFVVRGDVLWMLAIDASKKRTNLTDGTKQMLANRLNELKPRMKTK